MHIDKGTAKTRRSSRSNRPNVVTSFLSFFFLFFSFFFFLPLSSFDVLSFSTEAMIDGEEGNIGWKGGQFHEVCTWWTTTFSWFFFASSYDDEIMTDEEKIKNIFFLFSLDENDNWTRSFLNLRSRFVGNNQRRGDTPVLPRFNNPPSLISSSFDVRYSKENKDWRITKAIRDVARHVSPREHPRGWYAGEGEASGCNDIRAVN